MSNSDGNSLLAAAANHRRRVSGSPGVPDPDPVRGAPAPRPRPRRPQRDGQAPTGLRRLLRTRASGRGRGAGGTRGTLTSLRAAAAAGAPRGRPGRSRSDPAGRSAGAPLGPPSAAPPPRPLPAAPLAGGRARRGPRLRRARPRLRARPRGLGGTTPGCPACCRRRRRRCSSLGPPPRGGPGPQGRPRRPLGRGPHSARRARRRPVRLRGGGGGAARSPGCAAPAPAASPPRGRGASLRAREVPASPRLCRCLPDPRGRTPRRGPPRAGGSVRDDLGRAARPGGLHLNPCTNKETAAPREIKLEPFSRRPDHGVGGYTGALTAPRRSSDRPGDRAQGCS